MDGEWVYTYGMLAATMLCFASMAGAASPIRAEQFNNVVNIAQASQFVLVDHNTGTRIPGGYWDLGEEQRAFGASAVVANNETRWGQPESCTWDRRRSVTRPQWLLPFKSIRNQCYGK